MSDQPVYLVVENDLSGRWLVVEATASGSRVLCESPHPEYATAAMVALTANPQTITRVEDESVDAQSPGEAFVDPTLDICARCGQVHLGDSDQVYAHLFERRREV